MALTIDGTSVRVEIAPDDTLWAAAPTWVDVSDDVRSVNAITSGRTSEIEAMQPGTLEVLLDNRDRTYDLAYGPARVTFDGTAGNHWGCGDIAAFAGASQLDVRAAVAMDDWTPTAITAIIGQWGGAGNLSWLVQITAAGYLQLLTSSDGSASTARDSGVRVSAVNGQLMAIRVTWDNSGSGTTAYYVKRTTPERAAADCRSDAGWVALGASDTGTTTTLFNSTNAVRVGTQGPAGTASMLAGTLYYAQAATTIDATPDVVFWPKDAGTNTAATSWVSSESGETWTGTGSTYVLSVQSPYFGRLLPGTPVRVVATRSAVDYPLWYGYVRRSPQEWPAYGLDATVRLQALDGLGWLQDAAAADSPFGVSVAANSDRLGSYWPLREPLSSLEVADVRGASPGEWSGYGAAGTATQPHAAGTPRLLTGIRVRAHGTPREMPAGPFVFYSPGAAFWVHVPDNSATFRVVVNVAETKLYVDHGVAGMLVEAWDGGGGGPDLSTPMTRLSPGSHYVVVAADASGGMWVDGGAWPTAGPSTTHTVNTAGWPDLRIDGTGATVTDVVVGDVDTLKALWTTTSGETTGERVAWLLDGAGVPTALQDVHTEPSTYLGAAGTGSTWGELCRQVATAEYGRFYAATDGMMVFRSRLWDWVNTAATTSQATFGDQAGEAPYVDVTLEPADKVTVYNEVIVSLPNGASGTGRNAESIAQLGRRTLALSAPLASPGAAEGLASHIANLRAWPRPRIVALAVNPLGSTDAWAAILGVDLGERVTVNRRPVAGSDAITAAVSVERIAHVIDRAGTWRTSYLTAPVQPTAAEAGYLTFDDPVLGMLDAGLRFAP